MEKLTRDHLDATAWGERVLPTRERNLVKVAARFAGCSEQGIYSIARFLLGNNTQLVPGQRFRSQLNNDGSPLQLCLTVSPRNCALRMLGDPGSEISDVVRRHVHALSVLDQVLVAISSLELATILQQTLTLNLPSDIENWAALTRGTVWLGVPMNEQGIAIYLNGQWGEPTVQWHRVGRWLHTLVPYNSLLVNTLERLSHHCRIVSVGVEGVDVDSMRLKVYFRLKNSCHIADLGVDLLCADHIARFLAAVLGPQSIPPSGIVFSMSISAVSGQIIDAKIDICGHCLQPFVANSTHLVEQCVTAVDLPPFNCPQLALGYMTELAFLGCGISHNGSVRLNVYLKGCL